jgi:hypothetical protein
MSDRVIEIPAPNLQKIEFTLQGITPLITHRFGERALGEIEAKQQKKATAAREARDPDAEFKDALYEIKRGVYGFLASGVKKALVNAGGRFADGKMTVLRGALNIVGDLLEIRGPRPIMRRDHVVISGKTSTIAYRPMFMPWTMKVPVIFNAGIVGESQVAHLFQLAGFSVGIGDWRPECNGTYGQFEVL